MSKIVDRMFRALKERPDGRALFETAAAIVAFGAVVIPPGIGTGLLRFEPKPFGDVLVLMIAALPVPAIVEEFFFRGPIPSDGETKFPLGWIVGSTLLFFAWHVVEGLTFPGAAGFLRGDFLAVATVLSLACGLLRHRTGSLWPPILLHWAVAGAYVGCSAGLRSRPFSFQ